MSSPTSSTTPNPTRARYSAATWSGSRSGSPTSLVASTRRDDGDEGHRRAGDGGAPARHVAATLPGADQPPRGAQVQAGQGAGQEDRERADRDTGDVVDDVVPAEVDRGRDRQGEQEPGRDPQRPRESEQVRHQRSGEEERHVQRGEGADALRRAAHRVLQELDPLFEQQVLQLADRRGGQVGEFTRLEVDGPQRGQQEVAPRGEQPVDRLRGHVEEAGLQVAGEDQGERERARDEGEEDHVRARHEVGLDAGADQLMQQRRGIVPAEQAAVEIGQLLVEEVPRPDQGDHALEVAVRQVGHVEADQGGADGDSPRQRPALAPDARDRRARRPARARAKPGADQDVEEYQHRDEAEEHREAPARDVVGIPQRQPYRVGREHRGEQRHQGHDRSRDQQPPMRGHAAGPWAPRVLAAAFARRRHRGYACIGLGVDRHRYARSTRHVGVGGRGQTGRP